jgi:hypothetical protein
MRRKSPFPILFLLCSVSLPLSLASCISDGRGECVQYTVSARLVDKAGTPVPDSVARRSSAYLFINGKYERSIPAGSDGRYAVGYNGCDAVSLVVFGDKDIHGFTLTAPSGGSGLSGTSVKIDSLLQPVDTVAQSRLYYGSLDYSRLTVEENDTAVVCMYDRLARLHVILGDLAGVYGAGRFSISLGGLRNTLTYGGTATSDTVSVTPPLYRGQDGMYVSGTVATFATPSAVRVTVYRDGLPVASMDRDNSGRDIIADEGDNEAIVITVSAGLLNIRVMPWDAYLSQSTVL